ncbi:hypothetical protein BaOVIS_021360 [Babesia ovis]|uniref:Uncharacterized protein n=1 Tax=Babesia ovis TaxID=5869 RepID=A0A9W5WVW0_BABOV|nr:hypothetical protein BaOVIS_021360 [Babesia ovis]
MPTWALGTTGSHYRQALLEDISRNGGTTDPVKVREWFLRYVLEPEVLTTCVSCALPDGNTSKSHLRDLAALVHVGNSSIASRIAALHGSSGLCNSGLYCMPYESSIYFNTIRAFRSLKGFPFTTFHDLLQSEVVNGMSTMYTWNRKRSILVKPTGESNGGIEAIEVKIYRSEDFIAIDSDVVFKIYPSCMFYPSIGVTRHHYARSDSEDDDGSDTLGSSVITQDGKLRMYLTERRRRKRPLSYQDDAPRTAYNATYDFSNGYFVRYQPDEDDMEFRRRAMNTDLYSSWKQVSWRDSHILELRTGANVIYARSANGMYIGRCIEDDDLTVETINNLHYEERDKVHYIHPSPYIPSECAMLAGNSLLLYDATQGIEQEYYNLTLGKNDRGIVEDICQTLSFGMDMHTLMLGGERLYTFDLRAGKPEELLLKVNKEIRVTSTRQTERICDHISTTNRNLSGSNCAYSSYWKGDKPSFWGAFTAIAIHPVYHNIMACIYGISSCIYIWDLRAPVKPILEIPIPSTEYLGARFRDLTWSTTEDDGDSILVAFCWRHKYPISCSFQINRSITRFVPTVSPVTEHQFWNNWVNESKGGMHTNMKGVITTSEGVTGNVYVKGIMEPSTPSSSRIDPAGVRDPLANPYNHSITKVGPVPTMNQSPNKVDVNAPTSMKQDTPTQHQDTSTHQLLHDFASGKVFEDELEMVVKQCTSLEISRVSKDDIDRSIQSVGPLIEDPVDYSQMAVKTAQKELLLPLFHGFCGVTTVESGSYKILFACTTSGSIFAMDLCQNHRVECRMPSRSFDMTQRTSKGGELFRYGKYSRGSIFLPKDFITDEVRWIVVHPNASLCSKVQVPIYILCLNKTFVELQETECLPLSSGRDCFNSRSVLQSLVSQTTKDVTDTDKQEIMSLHHFENNIGPRDHLEHLAENVWDCNDIKIDFEYDDQNVNNHLLQPTPACHCFVPDDPDTGLKALSEYLKALEIRPGGTIGMGPVPDAELSQLAKTPRNTLSSYLSMARDSGLENSGSVPPQGRVHCKELGDALLFHSPVLPKIPGHQFEPASSDPDGIHKHFCGVSHMIGIKLRDSQGANLGDRIQALLGTWRPCEDELGDGGVGISRFHRVPNQVELLRHEQLERDRLVEHLLSQTDL